jgi:large subunit ribosomal protein LP2
MKHLAAYLLLVLGGNASPSEGDISKLLKSAGVESDSEAVGRLLEAVKGKVSPRLE